MKTVFLAFPLVFCALFFQAQTGPAGVGTSATNVFWLKADKGTSSTTNGTPISFWNDQSGNGINVTQATAAQQPSYATNVLNNFPGIQFDNVTGNTVADRMHAPDNASLDNTSGYSFFTVSKMTNIGSDARAIVSKRTAVDVDEAFMLFYWSSDYFYVDIDGLGDRFNTSPTTYVNNTGYILDAFFDGTLAPANRSTCYEEEILRKTSSETSTLVADKPSPLNIACTHSADGRPFGGYISEVMIYTVMINPAQRIIVNNYLSAKYNIALSANDKYLGDNPGNGNYDREVSGVGRESTGSNPSFSASISGGITISSNSGLDNTDYILAGHASPTNSQTMADVGGMTGINNARWLRIWYVDVTNTLTAINTNIEFDMSDGGVGPVVLGPASNYVLLYRAAQVGNWTELATATSTIGDRVLFNNYNLVNDGYYTIGTKNYLLSPLPINLESFTAVKNGRKVDLAWKTSSEKNNEFFILQKSRDGINFIDFASVPGALNKNTESDYTAEDVKPYEGVSYYRLKQVDVSGQTTLSELVAVSFNSEQEKSVSVFPNPSDKNISLGFTGFNKQPVMVTISDLSGREVFSCTMPNIENGKIYSLEIQNALSPGVYLITTICENRTYPQKIIVK